MAVHTNRMLQYLDDQGVEYDLIHHRLDFTAQRTASDTHTPGKAFAKVVVLEVGEGHAIAVLPAHRKVDFGKAHDLLDARVALASEEKVGQLFSDCEIGAESPFGNLYGLPVYVSPELRDDEFITFNAGTHHEAIRLRYADFERLVEPHILDLTWRG